MTILDSALGMLSTNQILSGGLMAGAAISVFHSIKAYPFRILQSMWRRWVVRFTIHSDDYAFPYVNKWLVSQNFDRWARAYRARSAEKGIKLGPDYGRYLFRSKGRWYWADVYKESQQAPSGNAINQTKDFISISCLGFTKKPLETLMADIETLNAQDVIQYNGVYNWTSGGWFHRIKNIPKEEYNENSLVLSNGSMQELDEDVSEFFDNEEYYKRVGIPYRRGYLLFGPPGTGKTSYIKHLAQKTGRGLYVIKAGFLGTAGVFEQALSQVKKGSIIAIEDIDSGMLNDPFVKPANIDPLGQSIPPKDSAKNRPMNLADVLNALDGVLSPEGSIIVATTNRKEELDEALIRPGRFDVHKYIGLCTKEQAERLFLKFFDDKELAKKFYLLVEEETISPADMQALLIKSKSAQEAIDNLKEMHGKERTSTKNKSRRHDDRGRLLELYTKRTKAEKPAMGADLPMSAGSA